MDQQRNAGATAVRKLGVNIHGRDFIVGDIHGAFDIVVDAMREARFDRKQDRLFSVGDLIDRGLGSHRCVKFLQQPYVHAVRGNHEDSLLALYADGVPDESVLSFVCGFNGMGWWLSMSKTQRTEILESLGSLPLAIEVETRRGNVGLIHADVPKGMAWDSFITSLEFGDKKTLHTCLWGRDRIDGDDHSGVAGIGRVFVGHTPQWGGVGRFGNVYAIDSGAAYAQIGARPEGHLTMARMAMRTEKLVAPRRPTANLVELKDDDFECSAPFGASLVSMRA